MFSSRCSLVFLLAIVFGSYFALRSQDDDNWKNHSALAKIQEDEEWKNHPALAEPDGQSHRGDKMIAVDIKDRRILAELSRRFKATRPLRITQHGVAGTEDFERRQEYLLRLLDYYWFTKERVVGMTRAEVEGIFGSLGPDPARGEISGGRDTFCLWFSEGRVVNAFYAMGY